MNKRLELVLDIVAVVKILIRTEMDHIIDEKNLFIEFLNESGFRTLGGKEFTVANYNIMMKRLKPYEISIIKGYCEGELLV
ncbi:MAG: hypothetical protein CL489_08740 [Acidobacteria bacterium]|nr:hypothetical protein [Acidobacteriota bacterium]|tara:strand:- start:23455 stop:23697 length:243 start_codon:yes stop_codon:yes gene_type:complete